MDFPLRCFCTEKKEFRFDGFLERTQSIWRLFTTRVCSQISHIGKTTTGRKAMASRPLSCKTQRPQHQHLFSTSLRKYKEKPKCGRNPRLSLCSDNVKRKLNKQGKKRNPKDKMFSNLSIRFTLSKRSERQPLPSYLASFLHCRSNAKDEC